jgi:hypothetical protein
MAFPHSRAASLIVEERDPAKVVVLADELARLLSQVGKPWPVDEKPQSS